MGRHLGQLVHERGRPEQQATGRRGEERIDEDQRSDLVVRSVGDHGKQKARTAVADEDDALLKVARRDAHRIRDMTPLRFGGRGNASQRRDHGGASAPFKLLCNR